MGTIDMPQKIVVEKNIALGSILADMGIGKKRLIVADENVIGIGKKMQSSSGANLAKLKSNELKTIEGLSSVAKMYDVVIAVGGGRTIDAVKYAAHLAKKPWVSFPTILSHDGIVSSRATISSNGEKASLGASEPVAILADIDILAGSPYRFTAAGAGDCLSNITAVEDWKIADKSGKEKYNNFVASLAMLSARTVAENAGEIKERSEEGLKSLLMSLVCSGIAMNMHGSSRPASGSEHNFSHALDSLGSTALHGEQCALGSVIIAYLQEERGFLKKRPEFTWEGIRGIMEELGLPATSEGIGISKDNLVKALVMAKNVRDRYTILDRKSIGEKEAEIILKAVEII